MEREIEVKFDITADRELLLLDLGSICAEQKWQITSGRSVRRSFDYYDTKEFDCYRNGETIRCVSGFPSGGKGLFRYDVKTGPIDDRYEESVWANRKMFDFEILENLGVQKYNRIVPVATSSTTHLKFDLHKEKTVLEATLDYFDVSQGGKFTELEFELHKGSALSLEKLASAVEGEINLTRLQKQKYARVVESMPKYTEILTGN